MFSLRYCLVLLLVIHYGRYYFLFELIKRHHVQYNNTKKTGIDLTATRNLSISPSQNEKKSKMFTSPNRFALISPLMIIETMQLPRHQYYLYRRFWQPASHRSWRRTSSYTRIYIKNNISNNILIFKRVMKL